MIEKRKLKVYYSHGKSYEPMPAIILKGKWLQRFGFETGTLISVSCEEDRLLIEPREPDSEPQDEEIEAFLSSLSKKRFRVLERSVQYHRG